MSTYFSDQEMGDLGQGDAWIDVASSLVEMDVRVTVDEPSDPVYSGRISADVHLTPDEADRVADALKRQAARVRAAT
jgi:hypothetical protein